MTKRLSMLAVATVLTVSAQAQTQYYGAAYAQSQAQPSTAYAQAPAPHPYALPAAAPARAVVGAPEWFVRLPQDTLEMMFAAGTATSTDEQMAYDKARMSAERKLIEIASSKIQSQTKSYRSDQGEAMIENFEQVTRKNAAGELIGAQRVDSQTTFDGRYYKVYVLLRLPLGSSNMLKRESEQARAARETELRSQRAQQDLERNAQADEARRIEADKRLREEIGPRPDPAPLPAPQSVAPVTVNPLPMPAVKGPDTVPTADGEVKLLQVDNEEYKRRRDEALAKPGAVIGNTTLR